MRRPTGDQEVAGSTPPRSATFFLDHEIFSTVILSLPLIHQPRWPPCPYMVKPFKNHLLQNRGCLGAESVCKSSRTGDLLKLLIRFLYVDI